MLLNCSNRSRIWDTIVVNSYHASHKRSPILLVGSLGVPCLLFVIISLLSAQLGNGTLNGLYNNSRYIGQNGIENGESDVGSRRRPDVDENEMRSLLGGKKIKLKNDPIRRPSSVVPVKTSKHDKLCTNLTLQTRPSRIVEGDEFDDLPLVTDVSANNSSRDSKKQVGGAYRSFGGVCGAAPLNKRSKKSGYVVNGKDQSYGDWPSYAQLIIEGEKLFGCGGVLISDRHILTAGHCIAGSFSNAMVYLGDHNTRGRDHGEQAFTVSLVRPCLARNYFQKVYAKYDYAVLTLDVPVPQFTNYIQPACLPDQNSRFGSKCYMVGTGAIGWNGDRPILPSYVQYLRVKQLPCPRGYGVPSSDPSRACWTKLKGQGDSCIGDSGGPILCLDQNNRWTVAALGSYGTERCDGSDSVGWAGVYTKITSLYNEIRSDCNV